VFELDRRRYARPRTLVKSRYRPRVQRFSPGDPIVLREIWDGRIWSAFPAIAVEDRDDLFVNLVPAGVTMARATGDDGSELRIPTARWSLARTPWATWRILAFSFAGERYAVLLFWDARDDSFFGYYVNVETSLGRTPIGFDYVDHLLDVLISADRSEWSWKDEDELEEAVARGVYTGEQAEAFRAAGERGLRHVLDRAPPFDRDWSTWRPDPAWPTPELREGWDRI
jgi:predicted RNA-binding protein associated with RNAse of E/G family